MSKISKFEIKTGSNSTSWPYSKLGSATGQSCLQVWIAGLSLGMMEVGLSTQDVIMGNTFKGAHGGGGCIVIRSHMSMPAFIHACSYWREWREGGEGRGGERQANICISIWSAMGNGIIHLSHSLFPLPFLLPSSSHTPMSLDILVYQMLRLSRSLDHTMRLWEQYLISVRIPNWATVWWLIKWNNNESFASSSNKCAWFTSTSNLKVPSFFKLNKLSGG